MGPKYVPIIIHCTVIVTNYTTKQLYFYDIKKVKAKMLQKHAISNKMDFATR